MIELQSLQWYDYITLVGGSILVVILIGHLTQLFCRSKMHDPLPGSTERGMYRILTVGKDDFYGPRVYYRLQHYSKGKWKILDLLDSKAAAIKYIEEREYALSVNGQTEYL